MSLLSTLRPLGTGPVPPVDAIMQPPQVWADHVQKLSNYGTSLDLAGVGMTGFTGSVFSWVIAAIAYIQGGSQVSIDFSGNALDEDSVNTILVDLANYATYIYASNLSAVDVSGGTNAAPPTSEYIRAAFSLAITGSPTAPIGTAGTATINPSYWLGNPGTQASFYYVETDTLSTIKAGLEAAILAFYDPEIIEGIFWIGDAVNRSAPTTFDVYGVDGLTVVTTQVGSSDTPNASVTALVSYGVTVTTN